MPTEDRLHQAIATSLAPVFLPLAAGTAAARHAAIIAIERMRMTSQGGLLTIAQAITFGTASLPIRVQSLQPDLDPDVLLWLNRNATSLSRTRDRHHRILSAPKSPGFSLMKRPAARHAHQTMEH